MHPHDSMPSIPVENTVDWISRNEGARCFQDVCDGIFACLDRVGDFHSVQCSCVSKESSAARIECGLIQYNLVAVDRVDRGIKLLDVCVFPEQLPRHKTDRE